MTQPEADIVHYRPEFKTQVLDLLQTLWGDDPSTNRSYFEWKYEANPYTESPLGIVALQQGRVAGFRGYFAVRFEVPGRDNNILVLCPGDTCVHPECRRQGLSVKMGKLAMREYAGRYAGLLNTTCNQDSMPGYVKMGFLPLAGKVYVNQASLLGVARYALSRRQVSPIEAARGRLGSRGKILVSQAPRPEEMSALVAGQGPIEDKIGLVRDAAFFHWRFGNPRGKYLFYYRLEDGVATGYVVLGLSANNRRGYLLDYAPAGGPAIPEILSTIRSERFDIVSIYGFGLDDTLRPVVSRLGFKANSLVRVLEKKLGGELPLLIRPVTESPAEADWFVEGLDMRKIESWSLKPIFSDAA